jgi:hypothetical protein
MLVARLEWRENMAALGKIIDTSTFYFIKFNEIFAEHDAIFGGADS